MEHPFLKKILLVLILLSFSLFCFSQSPKAVKKKCDASLDKDFFRLDLENNLQGCCESNPEQCHNLSSFSGDCAKNWQQLIIEGNPSSSCTCKNAEEIYNFFIENGGGCGSLPSNVEIQTSNNSKISVKVDRDEIKNAIHNDIFKNEAKNLATASRYFCHVERMYPNSLKDGYTPENCIKPEQSNEHAKDYIEKIISSCEARPDAKKFRPAVWSNSIFKQAFTLSADLKLKKWEPLSRNKANLDSNFIMNECRDFDDASEKDKTFNCFTTQEMVNFRNIPSMAELKSFDQFIGDTNTYEELHKKAKDLLQQIEQGSKDPSVINIKRLISKKPFLFDFILGVASSDSNTQKAFQNNLSAHLKTIKDFVTFSNSSLYVLDAKNMGFQERSEKLKNYSDKEIELWSSLKSGILRDTQPMRVASCNDTFANLKKIICEGKHFKNEVEKYATKIDQNGQGTADYYAKSNVICNALSGNFGQLPVSANIEFEGAMKEILTSWSDDPEDLAGERWRKIIDGSDQRSSFSTVLAKTCQKVKKSCENNPNYQTCRNQVISNILSNKADFDSTPKGLRAYEDFGEDTEFYRFMDLSTVNFLSSIGHLDTGAKSTTPNNVARKELDKPIENKVTQESSGAIFRPSPVVSDLQKAPNPQSIPATTNEEFSIPSNKLEKQNFVPFVPKKSVNSFASANKDFETQSKQTIADNNSDLKSKDQQTKNDELKKRIDELSKNISKSSSSEKTKDQLAKALDEKERLTTEIDKRKKIVPLKNDEELNDEQEEQIISSTGQRKGPKHTTNESKANYSDITGPQNIAGGNNNTDSNSSVNDVTVKGNNEQVNKEKNGPQTSFINQKTPDQSTGSSLALSLLNDPQKLSLLTKVDLDIEMINNLEGADLSDAQIKNFLEKINIPADQTNFIIVDPNTKKKYVVSIVKNKGLYQIEKLPIEDADKVSPNTANPKPIKSPSKAGTLKKLNSDLKKIED